ncbi:nucleoside deaminase [Halomicroarcula sp. GCM10025817]|uniref:nucleoside deaminase n=1 Tax=Haloarcula TaxID=2237 RepID=UPI0023E8B503|nr:nucleoside deaminase [Halomicroarcula sp. SYNS111]
MACTFETFDHESHLGRAFTLAREAAERGDRPFGSVLVRDDAVVMEAGNRVVTEDDVRAHPELTLATRAIRELTPSERAETVLYTSTEPCPMCAGGIRHAGLGRVVYSVGGDEIGEFTDQGAPVRSAAVLAGVTDVVGPLCNESGRAIHEAYDW